MRIYLEYKKRIKNIYSLTLLLLVAEVDRFMNVDQWTNFTDT